MCRFKTVFELFNMSSVRCFICEFLGEGNRVLSVAVSAQGFCTRSPLFSENPPTRSRDSRLAVCCVSASGSSRLATALAIAHSNIPAGVFAVQCNVAGQGLAVSALGAGFSASHLVLTWTMIVLALCASL